MPWLLPKFFLEFSQIELFEKIYFYKFSHLQKVLEFFCSQLPNMSFMQISTINPSNCTEANKF